MTQVMERVNEKELRWKQSTRTIEVPYFKLNSYKRLLKRLNRFSNTMGFPRPISTQIDKKIVYLVYEDEFGIHTTESLTQARNMVKGSPLKYLRQIEIQVFSLTIVDEIKPIDDWELLGIIDYKDSVAKNVPGKEIPMSELRDINLSGYSNCDHCNRNIERNKTVFVRNTETGEIKHIGGTCTKYYLGLDYEGFIRYVESLYDVVDITDEYDEDWGEYGTPVEEMYKVSDIIKYYIWHTRQNGHVTGRQADAYNAKVEDGRSTKSSTGTAVTHQMNYITNRPVDNYSSKEEEYHIWLDNVDKFYKKLETVSNKEVQEILDFVDQRKEESTFMFSVNNLITKEYVASRTSRYITGACSFYFSVKHNKEILDKENNKKAPSTHIGRIDERYGFKDVTVVRISGYEGSFGWVNIYTMEDNKGNVITKFGTINERYISCDSEEVVVGTKLSFTSPIMDHTEFRGTKQTKIGRLSKYNPKLNY